MGFNVSSFFSGFGSNSGDSFGSANWLSDYRSIKNGSYGKLMKAYYSEANQSSATSKSKTTRTSDVVDQILADKKKKKVETEESKAYTSVKNATDKLNKSIDKLQASGDDSIYGQKFFTVTDENGLETTEYGYDKEAIYNAVNDFVKSYNSVLSTSGSVNSSSIANRVAEMQNDTKAKEQALGQLGITINANNTLSIDKDAFMKADMKKVEELFGSDNYYTKGLAQTADMISYNANYEQLRGNTYTYEGAFSSANTVGKNYSSSL